MRTSSHINRKPAANIHHAVRIADHLGIPLNRWVTINFSLTESAGRDASFQFARLRKDYFGKWVTRPAVGSAFSPVPPTFVWAFEHGGGHLAVHWLVHVPPGRFTEFGLRLSSWVEVVAGKAVSPRTINVKPATTPRGACKYMLKGIDPAYASFYGIDHSPQGRVDGRRSGMSRNLGPAVKRRLQELGEYRVARWARPFPGPRSVSAGLAQ